MIVVMRNKSLSFEMEVSIEGSYCIMESRIAFYTGGMYYVQLNMFS